MNNEKVLIFPENLDNTLAGIFKKYNLKEVEDEDEILKKLESDQPFLGEIVMDATRGLFNKSMKETDAASLLKEKLNLSKESATALIADIKQQILPLIKEETIEEEPAAPTPAPISEAGLKPAEDIFPRIKPSEVAEELKPAPAATPEKKLKKPAPIIKPITKESIPQTKGPDNYREPIE